MRKILKRTEYIDKIRPFFDSDIIKVITGIRRSGKSKLLDLIIDEVKGNGVDDSHIIKINFDDMEYDFLINAKSLDTYIKDQIKDEKKYYIFLDEIQNVEEFEKAIESLFASKNVSIFITGSNSKLLSGELVTLLTGRTVEFEVNPFTFYEYSEYNKINNLDFDEDEKFNDYLKWGGFPLRFDYETDDSKSIYLNNLYNSIIEKDILGRYEIRNKNLFKRIANYLLINPGKLLSIENITNYIVTSEKDSISKRTIYNYIDYLSTAYLTHPIKKYSIKGKNELKNVDKYYIIDTGFSYIKTNKINFDDTFLLENIIYNELKYQGYDVFVGKTYKSEVDFVAIKNQKKYFIQVTYLLATEETINREFGVFKPITDASPKIVMSLDKIDFSRDGIRHMNILKFLLHKENL